jgi:alanyl-tRNA synthetase
MKSKEIRSAFLHFFEEKGHTIVPSAPMVIKNDPTLMFTNAGMNQFKDIFLGNTPAKNTRVVDSQKCLRVSGKHNDLEEVGRDTYHHTMFEMLGNWSFGDYFKKEAIAWAWEFLTEVLHLDQSRLYVTVFEGDKKDNTEPDLEAKSYWEAILPATRVLFGNKKDNFWEMGDTGPCGPCSEIHIDLRPDKDRARVEGATLVNKDNPLVVEIWNLVFMQFNRLASGELQPLSARHVDTGMGFERLCMAVQGKQSNYDTDLFQPLIALVATLAGVTYGHDQQADIALRVIADHARAVSFAIADGQLPSNNGAGYVIRRILRRAIRYGFTFLNLKEPFIYLLVDELSKQMGNHYPELKIQQNLIEKVIQEEESAFLKTLAHGILKFENYAAKLSEGQMIDGNFAFELFDTYGFPIDLTQLMASEKKLTVDMEGFHKGLNEQKQRSRAAAAVQTGDWIDLLPEKVGHTKFVGYHELSCETRVTRYRKINTKGKDLFQIVLDQTPFYAESGGQVGDTGWLESIHEKIVVENTLKENNLIIHVCATLPDNPMALFTAKVNEKLRVSIRDNHSATHLLHLALRKVLGTHVEQKGSLVSPDRLRFDFSHFTKMSTEELLAVEKQVNQFIRDNIPLQEFTGVPIDKAKEMGAMALFGEKYGDAVRVIQFGDSIELCGGTHAPATGNIGLFKIVSEGAIAAGVRRIEAVTGEHAEDYVLQFIHTVENLKTRFNSPNILQAVQKLADEKSLLSKEIEIFQQEKVDKVVKNLETKMEIFQTGKLVKGEIDLSPDLLKKVAHQLREKFPDIVVVLCTKADSKAHVVIAVSDSLTSKGWNAAALIKEVAPLIQGGGGGQAAVASAGGKNPSGFNEIFNKITDKMC